jgi:hypothetical protein
MLWCLPVYLGVGAVFAFNAAMWRMPGARSEAQVDVVHRDGRRWWVINRRDARCDEVVIGLDNRMDLSDDERREMLALEQVKAGDWPAELELPSWSPEPWVRFAGVPESQMISAMEAREAIGWPMRCLTQGRWSRNGGAGMYDVIEVSGFAYPRGVLLSGAVVNVLYFALWPAVAHVVLMLLRRFWVAAVRRGQGLCVGCGYDRRGLSGGSECPECGLAPRAGAGLGLGMLSKGRS